MISLTDLIRELELGEPTDKVGIYDKEANKTQPIMGISFNADIGAYILIPDPNTYFDAKSAVAKRTIKEKDNG